MTRSPAEPGPTSAAPDLLLRADLTDVVSWDDTSLTLRLSDRMVESLRERLGIAQRPDRAQGLGDIDIWDLRQDSAWLRFSGRLDPALGPRAYRKARSGGDILADVPGPLLALLSIGGQRRSAFSSRRPRFAHHILAPGDDVGAVGLEGTARAGLTPHLQHLPWATRDALLAEALLDARMETGRALPLCVARAETDTSATAGDLAEGLAFDNLMTAVDNLVAAAQSLGTTARILAIGLDWGVEDRSGDPGAIARGLRRLMARIETGLARRQLEPPPFLLTAEAGTARETTHPAIVAHAELSCRTGGHRLVIPAPGYMFEQNRWGRPSDAARSRMAQMDAHALTEALARRPWSCPVFLLAEAAGTTVRVTAQAMDRLVLSDALGAGPHAGFRLSDTAAQITGVGIAPDDPQTVILTTDRPAAGGSLHYAHGAPPSPGHEGLPPNAGGVHDGWHAACRDGGAPLHRWALPAVLPIRGTA